MAEIEGTEKIHKFFSDMQKLIESSATMRVLGGFAIKQIVQRTRGEGKGVLQPGGPARRLKGVSKKYAEKRRRMRGKHPQAARGTSSNLTLFGSLLSTLIIKRATKTDVRLGWQDQKEDLKAEGQEKQGRRFLVLSGAEILQARRFLAEQVARRTP